MVEQSREFMKFDQERMEELRNDADKSLEESGSRCQSTSSIKLRKKYKPTEQFLKKVSNGK